jgi:hypothetical protein
MNDNVVKVNDNVVEVNDNVVEVNDNIVEDEFILEQLSSGKMKRCPFCGIPSELASGCNYVTCFCKKGFNGKSEYCWVCLLPKYRPDPASLGEKEAENNDYKPQSGACNDKSHNSH